MHSRHTLLFIAFFCFFFYFWWLRSKFVHVFHPFLFCSVLWLCVCVFFLFISPPFTHKHYYTSFCLSFWFLCFFFVNSYSQFIVHFDFRRFVFLSRKIVDKWMENDNRQMDRVHISMCQYVVSCLVGKKNNNKYLDWKLIWMKTTTEI